MLLVIKMIYSYKDLKQVYNSNYQIQKAVENEKIYKIEEGIYADRLNNHYLAIFTKKYPNTVISGDSAYYYHNLTDVIPDKLSITTRRTAGRIKDNYIKQSYSIERYYELGKTTIEYEGAEINVYDKERMLIELIKNKNNMPYDYYKEIIKNYRKIIYDLNVYKIQKYLEVYPNGESLFAMIQDEVF